MDFIQVRHHESRAIPWTLGIHLERALRSFLGHHGTQFPNIRTVIFGTYDECRPDRAQHRSIDFRVSRLNMGGKPQLSQPPSDADEEEDREWLGSCRLFNFVAWDHVSWPGNDFYGGARATDHGVKAAAIITYVCSVTPASIDPELRF